MSVRMVGATALAAGIGAGAGWMLHEASKSESMRNPIVSVPVAIGGIALAGRGGAIATGVASPLSLVAPRIGALAGMAGMTATLGTLLIRDQVDQSRPPSIEDAPLPDTGSTIEGATLGTLQLHPASGGGSADVTVSRDLPGSFDNRSDAEMHIITSAEPGTVYGLVAEQHGQGTPISWHVADVAVTRADGSTIAMDDDVLYDAFVHPVDGIGYGGADEAGNLPEWHDVRGDGLALAGFYDSTGGFWVPMADEPNMQPHRTDLPPGT